MRRRNLFHRIPMIILAASAAVWMPLAGQDKLKGVELYEAKEYEQAEQELSKVVEAAPENVTARYYLGLALLQREKNAEAVDQFNAAKQLLAEKREGEPRADQIEVGLGRAWLAQKNYDQAREALNRAKALRPENPEVFLYRGKMEVQREDYAAATRELEQALKLDPKSPYAHYYAGIAAANVRRPDKMVEHFQYFLKLAPDAPEANKVKSYLKSVR